MVGVHCSTVSRFNNKYQMGLGFQDLPRGGRPRRFLPRHERKITRLVVSGQCPTAADVKLHLQQEENLNVSTPSLRRILRRNGLVSRIKKKKPLLSVKHRRRRLAFEKKYKCWDHVAWSRVIWSDEAMFQVFNTSTREYCWKKIGTPLTQAQVNPVVKHGGGNIMVWVASLPKWWDTLQDSMTVLMLRCIGKLYLMN